MVPLTGLCLEIEVVDSVGFVKAISELSIVFSKVILVAQYKHLTKLYSWEVTPALGHHVPGKVNVAQFRAKSQF